MTDEEKIARIQVASLCVGPEWTETQAEQFLAAYKECQEIDREEAEEQRVEHEQRLSREGEIRRWGANGRPRRT